MTQEEQSDRLHFERKVERAFFEAGKALIELRVFFFSCIKAYQLTNHRCTLDALFQYHHLATHHLPQQKLVQILLVTPLNL
ncbi:hypothetical protein LC613_36990 [Nostoc sphaeroides CHAB 2801]|uniref:Uncharacterized protein n=1 Tax=Nostoc sphaeroides CCNUC1 TaxID=2653204 RepID=A0A5P8WCJ4_9NOSO|nr:hypothetical protein [Nostoc sphaeroides]MCC5633115.1 hypothetical protein [Nostoc sphaeroides CHAB 2801]QFS50537.1 hypothetical protein GXM_08031 [Nostoc sphaeroides CCNUC1]